MTSQKVLLSALALALTLTLSSCASGRTHADDPAVSPDIASSRNSAVSAASQEEEANPFAKLAGSWRVDGDSGAARLEITEDGRFTTYYASGAVETEGYILHHREGEMAQTEYTFRFYTDGDKPYFSILDLRDEPFSEFDTISEIPLHFERIAS